MFSLYVRKRDGKDQWGKVNRTAFWHADHDEAYEQAAKIAAKYPHMEYELRKDE